MEIQQLGASHVEAAGLVATRGHLDASQVLSVPEWRGSMARSFFVVTNDASHS